jgi:uncharacterized repeat protein (TIGR01451 family)
MLLVGICGMVWAMDGQGPVTGAAVDAPDATGPAITGGALEGAATDAAITGGAVSKAGIAPAGVAPQVLDAEYTVRFSYYENGSDTPTTVPALDFEFDDETVYRIDIGWAVADAVQAGDGFEVPVSFGRAVSFNSAISGLFDIKVTNADHTVTTYPDAMRVELVNADGVTPITTADTDFKIRFTIIDDALAGRNNVKGSWWVTFNMARASDGGGDEFTWEIGGESGTGTFDTPGWTDEHPGDLFKTAKVYDRTNRIAQWLIGINGKRSAVPGGSVVIEDDFATPGQSVLALHDKYRDRIYVEGDTRYAALPAADYPNWPLLPPSASRGAYGAAGDSANGALAYYQLVSVDWEKAHKALYDIIQDIRSNYDLDMVDGMPTSDYATLNTIIAYLYDKESHEYLPSYEDWYAAGADWRAAHPGETAVNSNVRRIITAYLYWGLLTPGNDTRFFYDADYASLVNEAILPVPQAQILESTLSASGLKIELAAGAVSGRELFLMYYTHLDDPSEAVLKNEVTVTGIGSEAWEDSGVIINTSTGGGAQGDENSIRIVKTDMDGRPLAGAQFKVEIPNAHPALSRTVMTGDDGIADSGSLGSYTRNDDIIVTETKAPAGYETPKNADDSLPYVKLHLDPANGYTLYGSPVVSGTLVPLAPDAGCVQVASDGAVSINLRNKALVYDVALKKWVAAWSHGGVVTEVPYADPNEPTTAETDPVEVSIGDIVTYKFKVYNQGEEDAKVPEIVDYLPADGWLTFDPAINPDWTRDADNPLLLRYTDPDNAVMKKKSDPPDPSSTKIIELKLTVSGAPADGLIENRAEISKLTNEDDEDVPDIDSTPDDTDDETPKDNEVDEDGKNGGDEDDHDPAFIKVRDTVTSPYAISCEVDKDTIRRTSAAYVSLPGKEGYDNVGEEEYRYEIDFRSTSSIAADEFVVDDPLENVGAADQVRVEGLWTPVVWGDTDGKYNLWYRTNLTDDGTVYSEVTANPEVEQPEYPNTGFKLWAQGLDATVRTRHDVGALGLADGEYITAIRLEYGHVEVGFTSKNYADYSLNDGTVGTPASIQDVGAQAVPAIPYTPRSGLVDWTPDPDSAFYAQGARDAVGLKPVAYMVTAVKKMYEGNISSTVTARIARENMVDADADGVLTKVIPTFTAESEPSKENLTVASKDTVNAMKTEKTETGDAPPGGSSGSSPDTGDYGNMIPWFLLALAALIMLFYLIFASGYVTNAPAVSRAAAGTSSRSGPKGRPVGNNSRGGRRHEK